MFEINVSRCLRLNLICLVRCKYHLVERCIWKTLMMTWIVHAHPKAVYPIMSVVR